MIQIDGEKMKNLICRLIIAILGVFQICWTGSFSKNLMASSMIEIVPSFENAPLVRDYWWKGYPESQGNAACPSRDDLLGPLESIISTFKIRKQFAAVDRRGWGTGSEARAVFESH